MQLVRFLVTGVLNTGVGFVCIYALMLLGIDYRLANGAGYALGCLTGFLLHRSFTFRYDGHWWSSFARWIFVVGLCYSMNLFVVIGLHRMGVSAWLAQIGGVAVYSATSFLGGRFFAFSAASRIDGNQPSSTRLS
mgnify:CR=1 FL=1